MIQRMRGNGGWSGGVSAAEMQEVVRIHDSRVQHRRGEHGGFVYEFVRRSGPRTLTVVAEIKQNECWLITGWRS
jgi:hypothetical protein